MGSKPTTTLYLRVPGDIKAAIDALAAELSTTINHCAVELLARGLAARDPNRPLSLSTRMAQLLDEPEGDTNG